MKIITWNVNGIRAIEKKGFVEYFDQESPDILCVQEVKAKKEQVSDALINREGYYVFWNEGKRAGYSGVATYSKIKPLKVEYTFGYPEFDDEGRIVMTEFENFQLFNIYFPNGQKDDERLQYKMDFYEAFLKVCSKRIKDGKNIIVTGDFNTAHKAIDLKNPKENEKNSGFLPIEREWLDKWVESGFVDTFRHFNKDAFQYTWWSYRFNARQKNIGWRIDYNFVSENIMKHVTKSYIHNNIMGSDHCPIVLEIY